MPILSSDLYLAYRQAKAALYFERRGVGLVELATFESALAENFARLRAKLEENGGWFAELPLGEVWIVPKKLHAKDMDDDRVIRIGRSRDPTSVPRGLDTQLRLSPSPEFAIVEVLFLWRFGPLLESFLSRTVLGYRLDLRRGCVVPTRRWLFEYWPKRYNEFRTVPLQAARRELDSPDGSVVVLSADLAGFYDSIDPSFLLDEAHVQKLINAADTSAMQFDVAEYTAAVRTLLGLYDEFRQTASRRLGLPLERGVPIGSLTSRIVANLAGC